MDGGSGLSVGARRTDVVIVDVIDIVIAAVTGRQRR
jgi:hypothetical protein